MEPNDFVVLSFVKDDPNKYDKLSSLLSSKNIQSEESILATDSPYLLASSVQEGQNNIIITDESQKLLEESVVFNLEEEISDTEELDDIRESLTTKNAVKFLLNNTLKRKVCRYCLCVTSPLSELDQILHFAGHNILYKVTIRDMVASFHPFKVADDPNFPTKICNKCLDRTISSYLFTQQCERSERALRNCFNDMFDKLEKLDPLERPKRRGRQKLNPNHNVLYAEHEIVSDYAEPIINIINNGTEFADQNVNNAFECPKCWQSLPSMESLLNHEKIHPKSMWYHCHTCGKSFPRLKHLRKHTFTSHDLAKQLEVTNNDFKCQDCGYISADYHQHLQHIEKHKFQTVMEHLVERRMNDLCAVCFSKSSKLVGLDNAVCLHGGSPELMGERNLYNILGSTIPEKPSYKYRELLVPAHAKIITIAKSTKPEHNIPLTNISASNYVNSSSNVISKGHFDSDEFHILNYSSPNNMVQELRISTVIEKKNNVIKEVCNYESKNMDLVEDDTEDKTVVDTHYANITIAKNIIFKNNIPLTNKSTYSFVISSPFVISKDDFYSAKSILYKFSSPYNMLQELEMPNVVEEERFLTHKSEDMLENNIENKSGLDTTKSDLLNEVHFKLNKCLNVCKSCWIFPNLSCKNCFGFHNKTTKDVNTSKIPAKCQLCWLFKHLNQCEHCKRPNTDKNVPKKHLTLLFEETGNTENETVVSDEINKDKTEHTVATEREFNIFKSNLDKTITEHEQSGDKLKNNRKRKIVSEDVDETKKTKWQCQICLTTNAHSAQCLCCDAQRFLNQNIKVNFTMSGDFFKSLQYDESKFPKNPNENVEINKVQEIDEITVENTKQNFNVTDNIEQANNIITKTLTEAMIIETKEIYCNAFEEMDVVDESPNTCLIPVLQPTNSNNLPYIKPNLQLPFQFHVGSTFVENKQSVRRFKRPIRRMATAIHK